MRRAIVLTFTAAALLFAAGMALEGYGREIFEGRRAAAEELSRFSMDECFHCRKMESWEKAAGVAWLLGVGVLVAGIKLSADGPRLPHRISMLGLDADAPRRVVRADAVRLPCPHDDEGLTPLERVIRAS